MQCVTTVIYSIKINGSPKGNIVPSRGICQGNPLSPYLFILCVEGLLSMIKVAVANGVKEGIAIYCSGPKFSYIFFANDSLIFCRASLVDCDAFQRILKVYEQGSGQQLNRAKTSLFFSSNTPNVTQE